MFNFMAWRSWILKTLSIICLHGVQGDSGIKVHILAGDSIGNREKRTLIWKCVILNGYRDGALGFLLFWSVTNFCLCGVDEINRNVDTRNELLARILADAALIKETWRWTQTTKKHDLRRRIAKCTDIEDRIFEDVLQTVTDTSFLCNILSFKHDTKIKINLTVSNLIL